MEFVDSALLADMIFEWHETPFCKLSENLQAAPQEQYSNCIMDAMLVDMDHLPEIIISPPEPLSPVTAKAVGSLPLWPNSESALPVGVSEAPVKVPLVVQQGATVGEDSPPAAPFTPRAVKQTRRASKTEPKSKAAMKVPARSRKRVGAEQVQESRPPTHAEHIIRERQRRDDMAAKYLVLESLLPPTSKRERAVVVADAAVLVKALLQKKAELLKRRSDLKVAQAAPNQHSPRSMKKIRSVPQLHNSPKPLPGCIKQQPGAVLTLVEKNNSSTESDPHLSSSGGAVGEEKRVNTKSSATSAINVHTGEDDIVVEVVWNRPCPNFQSSLLQAVESLGSEVTRCSILRVASGLLQCVITCSKPQVPSQLKAESQASEALIMGALRNVLTQSS